MYQRHEDPSKCDVYGHTWVPEDETPDKHYCPDCGEVYFDVKQEAGLVMVKTLLIDTYAQDFIARFLEKEESAAMTFDLERAERVLKSPVNHEWGVKVEMLVEAVEEVKRLRLLHDEDVRFLIVMHTMLEDFANTIGEVKNETPDRIAQVVVEWMAENGF